MGKKLVLAMLMAAGVVGQIGLRANTVLFAELPSNGVLNGAVGSTVAWGFDLQWAPSSGWLSVTNSEFSGVLGSDSVVCWAQPPDGGSQGIGSHPAVALAAEGMVKPGKFGSGLNSGSANLVGPDTISASPDSTVSLDFVSFGLGAVGLALLAWGLRPTSRGERMRGRGHERRVSGYLSQVLVTEFHRGTFLGLKWSSGKKQGPSR